MKHLLILIVFFYTSFSLAQSVDCTDLLSTYATKPQKVTFISCKTGSGQIILEANYKVSGKDSEEIERFLIRKYGMGKLTFVCCGWEPTNGQNGYIENEQLKNSNENYVLEVSMFANAEKEAKKGSFTIEKDRTKLDFYIKVRLLEI